MVNSLLLQNGTVLQHDDQDNVHVLRNTDILVVGNRIAQIGCNLQAPEGGVSIIDCSDKIISPGLIDAHHHLWQTQLKGRFGDLTLLDYASAANLQSFNFSPEDIFWGQLGGCLEALDAGTTCIVDNAHMSAGVDHGTGALSATVASGIRAIFCYGVSPLRVKEWTMSSFEIDMSSPFPPWLFPQMEDFARRAPFGDDEQVQIGFFFDSYFLPGPVIVDAFERMRNLGVRMITSHFRHWPVSEGQAKIPEILQSHSLLGPDVLLSHGNGVTPAQASLLSSAGVYIASTPDAEVFMASGAKPVAFREDVPLTCLGADCHSCGPSSMLHQMQIAMGSDRGVQALEMFAHGQYPKEFRAKVQDAFNLVTIKGARAAGLIDQIGSIAVGKQADLILFDTTTPTMACAVDHDPLVAVVRHAGVREVDTVIVGGRIRKQNGIILDVDVAKGCDQVNFSLAEVNRELVSWRKVNERLSASRKDIKRRLANVNMDLAREVVLSLMLKNRDILV